MEQQNLPIIAKRIWTMARVLYFMLKKNISKGKLLVDLHVLLKRGKLAGKALRHLISAIHHHHHGGGGGGGSHHGPHGFDYEFSCSNSPAFFHLPTATRRSLNPFARAHAPPTPDEFVTVKAVIDMLNGSRATALEASPAIHGFGRSPYAAARQLRVTDSPFPLAEAAEESETVDRAAEEFIRKFYRELKQQKSTRSSS